MNDEQRTEIINAIAKGISLDIIAEAEGVDMTTINSIITTYASDILARTEYIKAIGA